MRSDAQLYLQGSVHLKAFATALEPRVAWTQCNFLQHLVEAIGNDEHTPHPMAQMAPCRGDVLIYRLHESAVTLALASLIERREAFLVPERTVCTYVEQELCAFPNHRRWRYIHELMEHLTSRVLLSGLHDVALRLER